MAHHRFLCHGKINGTLLFICVKNTILIHSYFCHQNKSVPYDLQQRLNTKILLETSLIIFLVSFRNQVRLVAFRLVNRSPGLIRWRDGKDFHSWLSAADLRVVW
jgi:hypothetical protein